MIYIIELLGKLLQLVLMYKDKKDEETVKQEYSTAASNPRDFFDDGVLNNSDTKQASTDTVSKTQSSGQPE